MTLQTPAIAGRRALQLLLVGCLLPTSGGASNDIYPVFWAVQGATSYICPGCNSSAYSRNGSVDVAGFGLRPNNWTYIADWDTIRPKR